jgi:hypothetical protein
MKRQELAEGRLCRAEGRTEQFVILGNGIRDDNTIWCADDATGETHYLAVDSIEPGEYREFDLTAAKAARWASEGNAAAAWWLGWYYEGENHYRSTWYYVAAMRMNENYQGSFEVVFENANFAFMCEGVAEPDLEFLESIEEFNQFTVQKSQMMLGTDSREPRINYGKWQDAIACISDSQKVECRNKNQ